LTFTLPPEKSGHIPLLNCDESRGLDIRLLDLTMLAADEVLARSSMEQFAPLPVLCTESARVGW
jgi:hypothetical protein